MFAAEKPLDGELSLIAPDGSVAAKSSERRGGPPYFWIAEVATPAAGTWHAKLTRRNVTGECATITRDITVRGRQAGALRAGREQRLAAAQHWNHDTENLYSAWIEKLFDAPLDEALSWPALHEVLRDQSRNFLHNHLGLNEDSMGLVIRPDCADLPYFLRAYFAFKMGLPFGYAKCTRGGGGEPPRCNAWWNIQNEEPPPAPPVEQRTASAVLGLFGQQIADAAASRPASRSGRPGSFRASATTSARRSPTASTPDRAARRTTDDNTDYYPVPLKQDDAASRHRLRRPVRTHPGARASACRRPTARPACSSPSTASPTARSRASASGAATSCSRTIRRSAAPASSASGRSLPTRAAGCGA